MQVQPPSGSLQPQFPPPPPGMLPPQQHPVENQVQQQVLPQPMQQPQGHTPDGLQEELKLLFNMIDYYNENGSYPDSTDDDLIRFQESYWGRLPVVQLATRIFKVHKKFIRNLRTRIDRLNLNFDMDPFFNVGYQIWGISVQQADAVEQQPDAIGQQPDAVEQQPNAEPMELPNDAVEQQPDAEPMDIPNGAVELMEVHNAVEQLPDA
ncbi:hypothetical protein L1987_63005 [Smallanthus sonchifolius]|uniref:Uncharacterized protein n=1 Tax=Smallanthus sonchifolius TaxID=185202 RepID=A0ACB9CC34_9ASTR|nr:hypothetical protein L1987_63005 [Smallanthus sonchifolius]